MTKICLLFNGPSRLAESSAVRKQTPPSKKHHGKLGAGLVPYLSKLTAKWISLVRAYVKSEKFPDPKYWIAVQESG
jgi:hypothetical protein